MHICENLPSCQDISVDGAPSAEIIDFEQTRDPIDEARDRLEVAHMNARRRQRIVERVAAVRRYVAALEQRAFMGDSGALDWMEGYHLPPLEAAIKEHEELMALVRERLANVTWPGRGQR